MTTESPPPPAVRRDRLLSHITIRGFLRVTDAAADLGVSTVTVRADLAALEAAGEILRVHGGAMPRTVRGSAESSFESSLEQETAAKRAIGRRAAELVVSGNSVLLDVGTTALAVANALVERTELTDVLVVTNGLTIALALEKAMPRFTVVVTGGTLRPLQHSLVNPFASPFLEQLHADLSFIGCNGVDVDHGVTNINLPEAEVKQRMVLSSKRSVIIADASKLGVASLGSVGSLDNFEVLVTAGGATDESIAQLHKTGLEVLVAD
ncbi:MAG: DeoR/GlpR family DNA-binding transcription regulator [Microbacteriaceae bacterium]